VTRWLHQGNRRDRPTGYPATCRRRNQATTRRCMERKNLKNEETPPCRHRAQPRDRLTACRSFRCAMLTSAFRDRL
jgi:hypothetical protein